MASCKIAKSNNKLLLVSLIIFAGIILTFVVSDLSHPLITSIECSEELRPQLTEQYDPTTEQAFCLLGTREGEHLTITEMYQPPQEGSMFEVTYRRCSNYNAVGVLHTQPLEDCYPSPDDIYNFGRSKDMVIGVMCGPDAIFFLNQDIEVIIPTKTGGMK